METDYIGANSVAKAMEMSKLKKFIISRVGAHKNSVPVFEHAENSTNDRAINVFREWASNTDNSLPYEMVLFNDKADYDLSEEKSGTKVSRNKIVFLLNKKENIQQAPVRQNVDELVENAVLKMQMKFDAIQSKQQENELLKRIEMLDQKLNSYIEDEEEEEENENQILSGLNNPNIINLITLLSSSLSGKKAPATQINGISEEKQKNIDKAISILSRYDESIDTDLLKLSSLAENQTGTFEMLLKTLRSM
jgi:hypothetical protein